MNITYLHGGFYKTNFPGLFYFTYIFLTERMSSGMSIADAVIRHHQTQFQEIKCSSILWSPHLHISLVPHCSLRRKIKNEQAKTKTYLATTSMCWLLISSSFTWPHFSFVVPWSLRMLLDRCLVSADKTDQILNLIGSGDLNCTALQQPIWPYGPPIRTNNKYKVQQ